MTKFCPLLKSKCIGIKCVNCVETDKYFIGNIFCGNPLDIKDYTKYKISELKCKHFDVVIREGVE